MRVLFDQGTPVPLRRALDGPVETAFERGWAELGNGDLLNAAEAFGFDVLVTTDQNLRYQQNVGDRSIAIIVLGTTSWPRIRLETARIQEAIRSCTPGSYIEVQIP